ncbi:filamentous hemagglutinin N-terminal domain-containing protein, partial [Geoalkalibacter halelectricus]
MNKIFRLIWSDALGSLVAVAEIVTSRGRGAGKPRRLLLPAMALVLSVWILAGTAIASNLPTGGNIVAGSGSIATSGNTLTVTQETQRMAADWTSFSIGSNNTVNFHQPSSSAVALNRVTGGDASVIQGALNANGQVFLVNPNGVLFSSGAQVNVGGLVASTLNISNDDFMAGNYRFAGNSSNAIVNQGNITAHNGGTIALIAARIDNSGTLTAHGGNVLMGAGSKVTLDLGGPVKIEVEEAAIDALIE